MIDKLGKFFIVLNPRPKQELDEVLLETTVVGMFVFFQEWLRVTDIYGIYSQRSEAVEVANALLGVSAGDA